MKRQDLIRYLEVNGCEFLREGGNHTVYVNRKARKVSTVPRHREIPLGTARAICRQLGIPEPLAAGDYLMFAISAVAATGAGWAASAVL